jgi:hypothetical protein
MSSSAVSHSAPSVFKEPSVHGSSQIAGQAVADEERLALGRSAGVGFAKNSLFAGNIQEE